MRENAYQAKLIKKLKAMYPDAMVLKGDANRVQGICDILVLRGSTWVALECKRSKDAPHRPNQDYYVDKMNGMSYAAFIFPENEKEILDEVQRTLGPQGTPCVP